MTGFLSSISLRMDEREGKRCADALGIDMGPRRFISSQSEMSAADSGEGLSACSLFTSCNYSKRDKRSKFKEQTVILRCSGVRDASEFRKAWNTAFMVCSLIENNVAVWDNTITC